MDQWVPCARLFPLWINAQMQIFLWVVECEAGHLKVIGDEDMLKELF
jgi:hypothetical protein